MTRIILALLIAGAACGQGTRTLTRAELRDRIAGGWAGQMIGVSYGAPTEFRSKGKILEGELKPWTPARVSNALGQDDLYVDMTFAKVLDDKGINATTDDFGAMFRDSKYALWHANLAARRALRRGVPATLSGTPQYNAHANDIDFQIEADFIGLMTPGMPREANSIAWRAGRVMNYGDGIYGGMFVGCMYAAAFFEKDTRKVVEAGLACLPAKSPYAGIIRDLLAWHQQNPGDWKRVWQLLEDKWDKRDPCPAGALDPFNIDAKLNGAYIALGLLYGAGDMGKTLEISTRAGQDSDCNPSSAAGILGTLLGYNGIAEEWKGGIPKIAREKFRYTDFSFETIVESTLRRAASVITQAGGKGGTDGTFTIKLQKAKPAKLEVWDDYGAPVERVLQSDARWQFAGEWREKGATRLAAAKGAEASITFEGTGAIAVGPYLASGGKADVYLDGKFDRIVDVNSDETASKGNEAVWHKFRLKPGRHTVRLVVRGEPYGEGKGTDVAVASLVVFR